MGFTALESLFFPRNVLFFLHFIERSSYLKFSLKSIFECKRNNGKSKVKKHFLVPSIDISQLTQLQVTQTCMKCTAFTHITEQTGRMRNLKQ